MEYLRMDPVQKFLKADSIQFWELTFSPLIKYMKGQILSCLGTGKEKGKQKGKDQPLE